ncbi:hypothetical protein ABIE27_002002 [Paenibacillus sp. 4624]|uniref:hypothetical protein n=1 Tax=Paenibacillus sp. 4624 TaxID=3156453 RepID=UPI003D1E09F3
MEEIKYKIVKDIKKTGFPFELKAAEIIKACNWNVSHNNFYIDKDENKGREIDLIARYDVITPWSEDNKDYMEFSLIMPVELKQGTKHPWVFFTTEQSSFEKLLEYPIIKLESGFNSQHHRRFDLIQEVTEYQGRLARSFYEAFNGGRDDIFKALTGVVKALEHLYDDSFMHYRKKGDEAEELFFFSHYLELFEPVIIFRGELFEAQVDKENDSEVLIKETKYVQVSFNYISPNYQRKNNYVVHVVKEEYIEQFFNEKKEGLEKLFAQIKTLEDNLIDLIE